MASFQEQLEKLGFQRSIDEYGESADAVETVVDTTATVYIQRQTKGRKGKGVTLIQALPDDPQLLADFASQLRKKCGVGGSVKGKVIELQGDQRELAKNWLEERGFRVKLAGG